MVNIIPVRYPLFFSSTSRRCPVAGRSRRHGDAVLRSGSIAGMTLLTESEFVVNAEILQPVVALLIWTMVMWAWMYVDAHSGDEQGGGSSPTTRAIPASLPTRPAGQGSVESAQLQPSARTADGLLRRVHRARDRGQGDEMNTLLAWIYVGLRVIHSTGAGDREQRDGALRAVRAVQPGADRADLPRDDLVVRYSHVTRSRRPASLRPPHSAA